MNKKTFGNLDVLNFYKLLPFNRKSTLKEEIKAVRERRIDALYPGLSELLFQNARVLEVGCGVGWLSNSINYLYRNVSVLGIDFNPIAIGIAQEVAKEMELTARFLEEDLFLYKPHSPFDIVISFGVLHHTNNCAFALRRICDEFVRPGGHVMIGLYHKYGRQPFLEYFNNS